MLRTEFDQLVVPTGLAFAAVGCGYLVGMDSDLRLNDAMTVALFAGFGGLLLLLFDALVRSADNATVVAAIGYAVALFLIEPQLMAGSSKGSLILMIAACVPWVVGVLRFGRRGRWRAAGGTAALLFAMTFTMAYNVAQRGRGAIGFVHMFRG